LGIVVVVAPLAAGYWTATVFGLALLLGAVLGLAQVLRAPDRRIRIDAYISSVVSLICGILLVSRPEFVVGGVMAALAGLFLFEGVASISAAVGAGARHRVGPLLSGVLNIGVALLVWGTSATTGSVVLGIAIGLRLLGRGWTLLVSPRHNGGEAPLSSIPPGLTDSSRYQARRRDAAAHADASSKIDRGWIVVLVLIFLAIHAGRMQIDPTFLGLISPLVATLGDVFMALIVALLGLPLRLGWRRATRSLEAAAWQNRLEGDEDGNSPGERLVALWLDRRLRFDILVERARGSLSESFRLGVQAGLPLVAILVAVNPIWGFTWYFNTENWASGFWQGVTASRVEEWQSAMGRAAADVTGRDAVADPNLFTMTPDGIETGDFAFLVIGDPGEGDPSQWVLTDRIQEVASQSEVKFVVISSDVIYPSGDMFDYEPKFYLPFKGITQPIYAIPGNHDWFNALDAFAANFFTPDSARIAIEARVDADHHLSSTTDERVVDLIAEAKRLREAYQIRNGLQNAPWFEVRTDGFALIAVDTGILRKLDPLQLAWLRAALERSRDRFTMVLLGHPPYVAGRFQAADDDFAAIHDLIQEFDVPLVMAGDTHDFEYYREILPGGGDRHYVVNGGGGAYLSIGTALDFPSDPDVDDWAFYPSTVAVTEKLETQTPRWKWPFWLWVKHWNGWPTTSEWLSAIFDFNYAPSFQSFVEVRIERSMERVRMIVHGVDGPISWRDMQVGGSVMPPTATPDDAVELVLPLSATAD
jgi:uncharacterized membrane protein HdeD (DUF308 family)